MGAYLSTTTTSPQIVAAGGDVAVALAVISPSAGNFYLYMEQYTAALALIPGSGAYLFQAAVGGAYVNSAIQVTTRTRAAAGVTEAVAATLTVINTDCYTYLYLMQRGATVIAGAFAVGTEYEITSIGTTDFTLIGATANTVGLEFTATGGGAGTGTATPPPDPANDTRVDFVVVALQATSDVTLGGIDISSLMNMMITMMIVVMMMKMMMGAFKTS